MKRLFLIAALLITATSIPSQSAAQRPCLDSSKNSLEELYAIGLAHQNTPLRIHIGCGESTLTHYVNIDFPPSEHTVQTKIGANVFADITQLHFPQQTVDEIRSHHIFEHFDRQVALALLCAWQQWLKPGGLLVIETPDFNASVRLLMVPQYSYEQKQKIMRHIFGSHEAHWAIHCDGWYKEKFEHVLGQLGFNDITFEFTEWNLLHNIIVRAHKKKSFTREELMAQAKALLRENMVNTTSSEEIMWHTWCTKFDEATKKLTLD